MISAQLPSERFSLVIEETSVIPNLYTAFIFFLSFGFCVMTVVWTFGPKNQQKKYYKAKQKAEVAASIQKSGFAQGGNLTWHEKCAMIHWILRGFMDEEMRNSWAKWNREQVRVGVAVRRTEWGKAGVDRNTRSQTEHQRTWKENSEQKLNTSEMFRS